MRPYLQRCDHYKPQIVAMCDPCSLATTAFTQDPRSLFYGYSLTKLDPSNDLEPVKKIICK